MAKTLNVCVPSAQGTYFHSVQVPGVANDHLPEAARAIKQAVFIIIQQTDNAAYSRGFRAATDLARVKEASRHSHWWKRNG